MLLCGSSKSICHVCIRSVKKLMPEEGKIKGPSRLVTCYFCEKQFSSNDCVGAGTNKVCRLDLEEFLWNLEWMSQPKSVRRKPLPSYEIAPGVSYTIGQREICIVEKLVDSTTIENFWIYGVRIQQNNISAVLWSPNPLESGLIVEARFLGVENGEVRFAIPPQF